MSTERNFDLAFELGFREQPPLNVWRVETSRKFRQNEHNLVHWFGNEADADKHIERSVAKGDNLIRVTHYGNRIELDVGGLEESAKLTRKLNIGQETNSSS